MHNDLLIALTAIIGLAVIAHWIAWRTRTPSILIFLGFGFLVGPILHLVDIDHVLGELLFPVVSMAIAIILFEGGLTLRFADLRHIGGVVWRILSIGVIITWGLTTILAALLLGFSFQLALLTGAVLVVTGPTVIIPLLRQIRPSVRVASILRWEGIVIDPVGVVLAVLVFEVISPFNLNEGIITILIGLLTTSVIGLGLGYLAARLLLETMHRHLIPDYLENPFTLFLVLTSFTISNVLQTESGLLTVTVMGIVLANQDLSLFGRWRLGGIQQPVRLERIIEFKETLQTLIVSSLFIMLSARLRFEDLALIGWGTVAFVLALILIVRPLTIWVCTLGSSLTWQERTFISWMAPRGIVAAATASLFGLELTALNFAGSEQLAPVVFAVIIGSVIIYGLTAGPLAQRLGLSQGDPQGILIVGAHDWARAIAKAVKDAGFHVLLVDTNWANVQQARMEGLPIVYTSILSGQAEEILDLSGIGRVLALTSNDEVNTLTSVKFVRSFGRANVYQLPPEQGDQTKLGIGNEMSGRQLFGEGKSYQYVDRLFTRASIKTTNLTLEFDPAAYNAQYSTIPEPLFAIDKARRMFVATADAPLKLQPGMTVISLVEEDSQNPAMKQDSI